MRSWKDIQDEIRRAEEPLSPQAWNQMEAKLKGGRRAGFLWFIGLFLVGIVISGALFFIFWETEKNYYQPRIDSGEVLIFSSDQLGSSSLENRGKTESSETKKQDGNYSSTATTIAEGNEQVRTKKDKDQVSPAVNDRTNPESTNPRGSLSKYFSTQKIEAELVEQREPEALLIFNRPVLPMVQRGPQLNQLPVHLNAPTNELTTPMTKAFRLELRFFMAPTYNLPSLKYQTKASQTHKEFQKAIDNAVKPGWGLDAGFELRYRLFRNFRISTGFTYREIVTQNNYDFEVNEIPVIDSASGVILAYIPTNQPQQRQESSSNMYTFLNVPLSLYYEKPLSSQWTLTGEVINNISFLVNQSGYGINPTTLELEKSEESFFNKTTSSYQFRLGVRYKLTDNIYLALEPSYRKSYQDFIRDESVSWKPEDFSLSLTGIVILK